MSSSSPIGLSVFSYNSTFKPPLTNTMPKLPEGCLPFNEFSQKFNLGSTSTEKSHPATKKLSQTMEKNLVEGLHLLTTVDENVIEGVRKFALTIDSLAIDLSARLRAKEKGRIFLVGSGSSGRVGIDIAAKCIAAFPGYKDQIKGIIAGGESAMIRAKEGFEDSDKDGREALSKVKLTPLDTVILISASGTASFNAGCAEYATDKGANVYYFYNSTEIPERTQKLFKQSKNPVIPLELDIGPQAINGSTRLQGATLAEACLGSLMATALFHAQENSQTALGFTRKLADHMRIGLTAIQNILESIASCVKKEVEVFSDPRANFHRLRDESNQGYVTFIGLQDVMREILIDATETSPTFSTNLIRREGDSTKMPEFCAYLLGASNNREAWKALLGTDPQDQADLDQFLLAANVEGKNGYNKRPTGKGNLVIGVAKIPVDGETPKSLIDHLKAAHDNGAQTAAIIVCNGVLSQKSRQALEEAGCTMVILENIPHDPLGISETIALKQTLNLISNGSMVLMKKVHGNQMVDVRASNMKLIDRCVRLIKNIWGGPPCSNEELYHYVCCVDALKKEYESIEKVQVSSVVKIVLVMLHLHKMPTQENFKEVVDLLSQKKDALDEIINSGHY